MGFGCHSIPALEHHESPLTDPLSVPIFFTDKKKGHICMPSTSKQAMERQGELARIHIQTSIFNVSKEIRMHNSKSSSFSSSSFQSLEDEPVADQDITRFDKSLQELRQLRAQLHSAADYSETTFLNAKEKKIVMENTKEYICRAVVSVVDHLGTVSANLNGCLSQTNAFSEAELRINCLKQRLLVCEQYAHKLALTQLRWRENLTRYHRRYLSKPTANVEKACEGSRDSTTDDQTSCRIFVDIDQHELVRAEEEIPLFLYTYTHKPSLEKANSDLTLVSLPVRDGLSALSKRLINPTFHFQASTTQKSGRHRRSVHGSDILSLIRRAKRTA